MHELTNCVTVSYHVSYICFKTWVDHYTVYLMICYVWIIIDLKIGTVSLAITILFFSLVSYIWSNIYYIYSESNIYFHHLAERSCSERTSNTTLFLIKVLLWESAHSKKNQKRQVHRAFL